MLIVEMRPYRIIIVHAVFSTKDRRPLLQLQGDSLGYVPSPEGPGLFCLPPRRIKTSKLQRALQATPLQRLPNFGGFQQSQ